MKWHVWDFSDTVRVYFNENFRLQLFKLLKGKESRNKLAKKFGVNTSTIKAYFQTGIDSQGLKTYIPVKIIKKIPEVLKISIDSEFMIKLEQNIIAYRARAGWAVKNPILPIKETPQLYSIVAHMICDGTAGKGKTPCYYNTSKELREEFKKSLQIFGNVETNEYLVQSNVYAVLFPKTITDILSHIFEVPFVRTKNLPEKFFTAQKDCQYAAVKAMFDDEGCIAHQLTFTQKEIEIIRGIKNILYEIGIITGKVHEDNRGCHVLTVLSQSRQVFENLIGFTHPEKKMKLKLVVEKDTIRKDTKSIKELVYDVFEKDSCLTVLEITQKLNTKNRIYINNVLLELRKKGKLKSTFVEQNKPYLWHKIA